MNRERRRRGKSSDEHCRETMEKDDTFGMSSHNLQTSGSARGWRTTKEEKKLRQLCRQAERRLTLVFDELDDPVLQGIRVDSVVPDPGGGLMVLICPRSDSGGEELVAVLERLNAASGRLRSEVATAIHRKRTPQLAFSFAPVEEDEEEDDEYWGGGV